MSLIPKKGTVYVVDDDEAVRDYYVALVDRVARDFLAGVQRNIRVRVFPNPIAMRRTAFSRSYSRAQRAKEAMDTDPAPGESSLRRAIELNNKDFDAYASLGD